MSTKQSINQSINQSCLLQAHTAKQGQTLMGYAPNLITAVCMIDKFDIDTISRCTTSVVCYRYTVQVGLHCVCDLRT